MQFKLALCLINLIVGVANTFTNAINIGVFAGVTVAWFCMVCMATCWLLEMLNKD